MRWLTRRLEEQSARSLGWLCALISGVYLYNAISAFYTIPLVWIVWLIIAVGFAIAGLLAFLRLGVSRYAVIPPALLLVAIGGWLIVGHSITIGKLAMIALGLVAIGYSWLCDVEFDESDDADGESVGGFMWFVRRPKEFKKMTAYTNAARDVVVPVGLSDDDIREIVWQLRSPVDQHLTRRKIEQIGARAVPFLLEALNDPGFDGYLDDDDELPTPRRVALLRELPSPPPEYAVEYLAPFVFDIEDEIRYWAGCKLAEVGTSPCIEPVQAELQRPQEYGGSGCVQGLLDLKERHAGSPEFLRAIYPDLLHAVETEAFSDADDVVEILLWIDTDRAIPDLHRMREVADEKTARAITSALQEQGVQITIGESRQTIARLRPVLMNPPDTEKWYSTEAHEYQQALVAIARAGESDADYLVEEAMSSPLKSVREAAVEADRVRYGMQDPYEMLLSRDRFLSPKNLNPPQQAFVDVWCLDGEIDNGGFAQVYFNGTADRWPQTIKALDAIGAQHLKAQYEEANSLFGKRGPSTNREKRQKQLSKLSDAAMKRLDQLSSEHYEDKDHIEVLIHRYVLEHFDEIYDTGNSCS